MRPPVYMFIISIHYCLCNIDDGDVKKVLVKQYPKKVKPGLIQINNSGKYAKTKPIVTKRQRNIETNFTAFPRVYNDKFDVPDSPYFPFEKLTERKSRVKKVLSENDWIALRRKRSVDNQDDDKFRRKELQKGKKVSKITRQKPKKGNGHHKLSDKPSKKGKAIRTNKHIQRQGAKKTKKIIKHTKISVGKNRNRNHKKIRNSRSLDKLKSKFGDKQAKELLKARNDFLRSNTGGRRLIAARDAMIEDYPYVVSIQKNKQHWCAGALLNPRLVITTANCLWKSNRLSHMLVRAGSRHTDRGGQLARIQEVMKHPGWKIRKGPDNDVALVLLDRNMKFSNSVHGVDLPNRVMMPAFEDAWITSWGTERRDGVYEDKGNTLQVYHARIIDRAKCNNVTQRFGVAVTENFICLAQTGRRAPCTRDTGAPAVSDGVLWGLASWGIRKLCGTERFPAMFSYLGAQMNLDFIINATRYLMADERYYPFPDRIRDVRTNPTTSTIMTMPF